MRSKVKMEEKLHMEGEVLLTLKLAVEKLIPSCVGQPEAKSIENPYSKGWMRSEAKVEGKLHMESEVLSTLKPAVEKLIPSCGGRPEVKPVEKPCSEG